MEYRIARNPHHGLPCLYDEKGTPLLLSETREPLEAIADLMVTKNLKLLAALCFVAGVYNTGPGIKEIERNIAEGRKIDRSFGIGDHD